MVNHKKKKKKTPNCFDKTLWCFVLDIYFMHQLLLILLSYIGQLKNEQKFLISW